MHVLCPILLHCWAPHTDWTFQTFVGGCLAVRHCVDGWIFVPGCQAEQCNMSLKFWAKESTTSLLHIGLDLPDICPWAWIIRNDGRATLPRLLLLQPHSPCPGLPHVQFLILEAMDSGWEGLQMRLSPLWAHTCLPNYLITKNCWSRRYVRLMVASVSYQQLIMADLTMMSHNVTGR